MTQALAHRGPDGSGTYTAPAIGLGHRRLSIIDVEGGAQPMCNEERTIWLVFNGEIYNFIELRQQLEGFGHRFRTNSDTEVILHAYGQWGTGSLSRLNGIFAFALWDETQRTGILARDRLGVKPLYYAALRDRLLFGSEIKALLADPACPREVDLRSLGELFTLRYVLSPNTMFAGIQKLPAGHYMTFGRGASCDISRYWNWTPPVQSSSASEGELLEQYRYLVEDAVRMQMRSDVPVGLWLSSGVDSGALLSLMRQHARGPVSTFTIGFVGGEKSNETNDARQMAAQFDAEHTERIVGPADYEQYLSRHLRDLEEPLASETAAAYYFLSYISSQKVKVVLKGQGVDELWAGYPRHLGTYLAGYYTRAPQWLTRDVLGRFAEGLRNEKLRRGCRSLYERDMLARLVDIYTLYTPSMRSRLLQPWLQAEIGCAPTQARQALGCLLHEVPHLQPLAQMLYIDTRANLVDDLLMVGDKMSMATSIEARVPFLDHRIVEFVETIPSRYKLRYLRGKYLHKKAAEKWLPRHIVYRKKKGFANPVDQWFRGPLRPYVRDCLLSDGAVVHRYFNQAYIQELLSLHESGQRDLKRQIFLLIQFELWHREFFGS